jgi:hypothetical protein
MRSAQRGCRRQCDRDRRADKGENRKKQRKAPEPAIITAEKSRKHGGNHDTEQRGSLAYGSDAGVLHRIAGELRTPRLMIDRRQTECAVDEHESNRQPPDQRHFGARQRREQGDHSNRKQRRGEQQPTLACAAAIGKHAKQRIDYAVREAQHQQHAAEHRQVYAKMIAAEFR